MHASRLVTQLRMRVNYVLVGVVGLLMYLPGLGEPALRNHDEAFYAMAAQQMVINDHWLIPYIHRTPARFEMFLHKPPLVYWLQAASMSVFGTNTFAVRLPSALAAVGTALLVFHIGRTLYNQYTGLGAAFFFLLLRPVYWGSHGGRTGDTDMLLVFFGSLFVWWLWQARHDRRRLIPAGAAAGLAVMTKGVAAGVFLLIAAPIVASHIRTSLSREAAIGAAVALGIMLPWPLYALSVIPNTFMEQMIYNQVLGRTTGGRPGSGGILPFMNYPYFEIVLTGQYFSTGFKHAIAAGVAVAGYYIYRDGWRARTTDLSLLWWAAAVPILFALTGGNHSWYLLPMTVPLAILTGRVAATAFVEAQTRLSLSLTDRQATALYTTAGLLAVVGLLVMYPVVAPDRGAQWHDDQREMAASVDLTAPNEVLYVEEGLDTPHSRFMVLAFYTQGQIDEATTDTIRDGEVTYAVVSDSTLDDLDREHDVLHQASAEKFSLVKFTG